MIYCDVTKHLLQTNGYIPWAQENIRYAKTDDASLWTGPNKTGFITFKKENNKYVQMSEKRQIQYITHWEKWQEKSLEHFRGKIFWGMSVYIFIDIVFTEICKQLRLTQLFIQ